MMVAPSEPAVLRGLGRTLLLPERYGVDFMWGGHGGLAGVQRKEFPSDFLASVTDGRLSKEVQQMQALSVRALVLEGRPTWSTEGMLATSFGEPWSKSAHRRYLASVQAQGVWVFTTDNIDDTISFLGDLRAWTRKPDHKAMTMRPGAKPDRWGRVTSRAWQRHLVQGIEGVGPELAERIIETLGMPFGLRVTEDDLMRVHGVGKKRARQIMRAFEEDTGGTS